MEKIHNCKENTSNDVRIVFDKINVEKTAWFCEQTWFASKVEVENGEAENVGDTISFHIFLVNFCPFCGEKLNCL
ncbi:MAG: hypothetical protein IME93_00260 [Proteobacteria bacterium]|nr:hypothetical protein [Pseudomonadota bacterium]